MEGRPVQHVLGKRSSVVVRGPANSRVYRWTADRTSTSNGVFQTEHVRGTRVAGSTRYQLSAGRYTMERGNLGRFHIITVR